ncbi:hypothetical protein K7432_002307 [Basidiobolus ranarum]|uniref:Uncharacterized protein n=1 Tax=Basidiobolus ranarum TaxID=34480 RepID=A0ABR2W7Z4_9FUNG
MTSLTLSTVTVSVTDAIDQTHKRYGRIFLTESCATSINSPHMTTDEKRHGQIFLNQDTTKDLHDQIEAQPPSHKMELWYTLSEIRERKQLQRRKVFSGKPSDGLDDVRWKLRSVKNFDDMLNHGFLVNSESNEYVLTIQFSLTPKIARDRGH